MSASVDLAVAGAGSFGMPVASEASAGVMLRLSDIAALSCGATLSHIEPIVFNDASSFASLLAALTKPLATS